MAMAMANTFSFCLSNMARFTYHIYFVYFGGFFFCIIYQDQIISQVHLIQFLYFIFAYKVRHEETQVNLNV